MRIIAERKHGKIRIIIDGEDNIIFQTEPVKSAFTIDKSVKENDIQLVIMNNYIDFIDKQVADKMRQNLGKKIKDIIYEDDYRYQYIGWEKNE
ncbi:MAG: hypothetical protein ACTSQ8_23530 [Candidatus Helarchaeota archaeon]